MLAERHWPSCTRRHDARPSFVARRDAVYIYGESEEERSHLPDAWRNTQFCQFARIEEAPFDAAEFKVDGNTFRLRSRVDIARFVDGAIGVSGDVYLDITGLSHHVWAPIVTVLVDRLLTSEPVPRVSVVYVEPADYAKSRVPKPGDIFALSAKVHGLKPLPGLARLRRDGGEDALLFGLVGFEGWRFDAILAQLEPDAGSVYPIIGVPGFRAEYPFFAAEGNTIPLEKDDNFVRRQFATANDPFEVVLMLRDLQRQQPSRLFRLALVGTKPHALGAVLFHALERDTSELVYDNPVRSAGRTDSDRTLLEYDIAGFLELLKAHGTS